MRTAISFACSTPLKEALQGRTLWIVQLPAPGASATRPMRRAVSARGKPSACPSQVTGTSLGPEEAHEETASESGDRTMVRAAAGTRPRPAAGTLGGAWPE